MPSDAAMKLAERIVEPVETYTEGIAPIRQWRHVGGNGVDELRAAEVARIAAIIDEGLAEVERERDEAVCSMKAADAMIDLYRSQKSALVDAVEGLRRIAIQARGEAAQEQRNSDGLDDKFNVRDAWIRDIDAALAACRELKGAR